MPVSKSDRFLTFFCAADSSLLVTGLSGEESMSSLFQFSLDMISETKGIDPNKMLGKPAEVTIGGAGEGKRTIHGVVASFSGSPNEQRGYYQYKAVVAPRHFVLQHRTNNKVFQNKSVPDIIEEVLQNAALPAPKTTLNASYQARDHVIQFMETDWHFISRLMQEEGIFYFFEFPGGDHKLHLTDDAGSHGAITESTVQLRGSSRGKNTINSFDERSKVLPGKVTHTDYNFKTPDANLENSTPTTMKWSGASNFEVYEYPGYFETANEGRDLSERRMEAIESGHTEASGNGTHRFFSAGNTFTLAERGDWLLTRVRHVAQDTTHLGAGGTNYANEFTCVPVGTQMRPPRTLKKPVMPGPQTAVVVGPQGEEIYTDEYGRIRIQFHWDRDGQRDEMSTCWCRVAQMWAGAAWGTMFIPRIKMEVVVDFINGDPDHPIVTGCVYNANNMPPWALPANRTQSGLRTRSTLKGEQENENVLQFEDKKGEEFIYFHAEKDFKRHVENDDTLYVGHDQTEEIKNARKTEVKEADDTLIVHKGHRITTIKKGDFKTGVDTGSMITDVKTDVKMTVKMGNHDTKVSMGNMTTKVSMGNHETNVDLGAMTGEAMQKIEFKVGPSTLTIDMSGITLKGPMIKLQGDAMVDVKAPMTMVKGDAMVMIKGGIVLIN